ncbi:hypothetical protein GWI33_008393 [Rhynchophorus ferrugineus]|uniref:Uncharacterized protein n=1 Tax=Rhynchophorus ferrugineus TaxID=354439 RepID=A0A834IC45_RHYFE|nr:hypothetical protein GWI33_008393 [Rhynchophorus ferrugineus]
MENQTNVPRPDGNNLVRAINCGFGIFIDHLRPNVNYPPQICNRLPFTGIVPFSIILNKCSGHIKMVLAFRRRHYLGTRGPFGVVFGASMKELHVNIQRNEKIVPNKFVTRAPLSTYLSLTQVIRRFVRIQTVGIVSRI